MTTPSNGRQVPKRPTGSQRSKRQTGSQTSKRPTGSQVLRGKAAQKKTAQRRTMQLIAAGSVVVLIIAIAIVVKALTNSAPSISGGGAYISANHTKYVLGAPIDGIGCGPTEGQAEHVHAHLDVVIDGKTETAPADIGIIQSKKCLYWVHVHPQTPGAIHIEAPVNTSPTFGTFLDIWATTPEHEFGTTVDRSLLNTILTRKPDVVAVNGRSYSGDIRAIPLQYHTMITLGYGTHSVQQAPYDFTLVDG